MEERALARLVRPRVIDAANGGGEPICLEDAVERRIERREDRVMLVEGAPGAGKRTAIEYLRRHFASRPEVSFPEQAAEGGSRLVCVSPGGTPSSSCSTVRLALVPWACDEWIEYLLARHPRACTEVMARLETAQGALDLQGLPLLWSAVLDELARDPELATPQEALSAAVRRRFVSRERLGQAAASCWHVLAHPTRLAQFSEKMLALCALEPAVAPFLTNERVHLVLGAEHAAETLALGEPCTLPHRIAGSLLGVARPLLRAHPEARATLERMLCGDVPHPSPHAAHGAGTGAQAGAASFLHLYGPRAVVRTIDALSHRGPGRPRLSGASLDCLEARGADLHALDLFEAHLRQAELDDADLSRADLSHADLCGATLRGAKLVRTMAFHADLSGSDLRGACLDGADLGNAQLREARLETALLRKTRLGGADLRQALLDRADLSGARLDEARLDEASLVDTNLAGAVLDGVDLRGARLDTRAFAAASLVRCNLEEKRLDAPDFSSANLHEAQLASSHFTHADLRGADLSAARLARIDWEGANLSGADLTDASFQPGPAGGGGLSSQPGWELRARAAAADARHPGRPAPEEIRRANLRGADLRGARILGVDFHLVDLRGALYTSEQEQHLRDCGAIL